MSLARIVASNPSTARQSARALREAGYDVEIVPRGTPSNPEVDLEFDADTNNVVTDDVSYVPGQREFVLKPLWRKLTARFHADRDVALAHERRAEFRPEQAARVTASAAPERKEEQEAREAALAVAEQRCLEKEEARRVERLRLQQQELARQREQEQQELILRQQEEERRRTEAIRRTQEAEATRQLQLARQREESRRQETARRKAEEDHRLEVLRQRQDEEHARRAEAQRLLIEANKQREESVRHRPADAALIGGKAAATVATVPTLRQYINLRFEDWERTRLAKAKVTRIDRSGASARRQAWPITAGVAAAFLLGWGIAAYHDSTPKAAMKTRPPVLMPGQYAPYPVAATGNHPRQSAARPKAAVAKRRVVRDLSIAHDEVVVRHYDPQKNVTAQNRAPQRRRITDLQ